MAQIFPSDVEAARADGESPDELAEIAQIGHNTLESLRHFVAVEGGSPLRN